MTNSLSSADLCVICQVRPYDLVCTCGDKFDFTCIHFHAEQIDMEFVYVQEEVGKRLLQIEQLVENKNTENARTIIENWKRKRIQDINDIADDVLHNIQEQENVYSDVTSFRTQYNSLSGRVNQIDHEQLSSMIELQRGVLTKSDQLETASEILYDDLNLNAKLELKLNPDLANQISITQELERTISSSSTTSDVVMSIEPITTSNSNILFNTESTSSTLMTASNIATLTNTRTTKNTTDTMLDGNSTMNNAISSEFTDDNKLNNSTIEDIKDDEFEVGLTVNIQRQNPILISTSNDKYAGTLCCHENQLVFNNYDRQTQYMNLVLLPDVTQPTVRYRIDWIQSNDIIRGGDDNWIQDIVYSNELQGYLLLNRAGLRLLRDDTHELEEFCQFPDRSMKRVTCDDRYIYLISAAGSTGQNGDEIIILNYNKEEKICKTFRDIICNRNNRIAGALVGEISDIAVNANGQIIVAYRFRRRQEVGVYIYNISNEGHTWSCVKQLLFNDCWHDDLSYTPRTAWCEKLKVFIVVEYVTGHLIMLNQTGQVKGECRLKYAGNRQESPVNISISNDSFLCVRYPSAICIYRLQDIQS